LVKDLDVSEIATDLLLDEDIKDDADAPVVDAEDDADDSTTLAPVAESITTTLAPVVESVAPTRVPSPSGEAEVKAGGSGKLIEEELRATGRVKGAVYKLYLSAAGYETWVVIVLLIFAGRAFRESMLRSSLIAHAD
jgi:hypothetical protein